MFVQLNPFTPVRRNNLDSRGKLVPLTALVHICSRQSSCEPKRVTQFLSTKRACVHASRLMLDVCAATPYQKCIKYADQ